MVDALPKGIRKTKVMSIKDLDTNRLPLACAGSCLTARCGDARRTRPNLDFFLNRTQNQMSLTLENRAKTLGLKHL